MFAAEQTFVRYISGYVTSLCGVWWCSNKTYMTSAFPKVKKSSSWKTLCPKREVVYVCVHSHRIT